MSVERGSSQHRQYNIGSDTLHNHTHGSSSLLGSRTRSSATQDKGKRTRGEARKPRADDSKKDSKDQKNKGTRKKKSRENSPQDQKKRERGKGPKKETSRKGQRAHNKNGEKARRSKKVKRGKSKEGRNFAVWRAVTLFPRPSLKTMLSTLIYACCLCYACLLIYQAHTQLEVQVNAQGIKRTFYARSPIAIPLPNGEPPMFGQLIDQREISLWQELKRRSGFNLKSEPPLITHPDPQVNRGAWYNALRDRKVEFIESQGVGDAGEPSLLWPPLPAPQPTLIVGHAFDKIAWVHPQRGIVLSEVPPSWRKSTSYRLPPETSRRW